MPRDHKKSAHPAKKLDVCSTRRLAELGDSAKGALHDALRGEIGPEARRRIEQLLALPPLVRAPDARRHLRAMRILEHVATSEARQVLETLAGGAAESRLTQEAKASLERLAKGYGTKPARQPEASAREGRPADPR
jgi:hypothetical protein